MKAKLWVLVVVALAVWGLKRHYAGGRADDLWWILSPTARVAGAASGSTFTMVPSEGYVSHERLFVIEKSCAGINFMAAAFAMLVCAMFHRVRSGLSGASVLASSLLMAYVAAVLVNATRITISLWLADQRLTSSVLSASQLHRLEGVTVYFAGLVLLYEFVRRIEGGAVPARSRS